VAFQFTGTEYYTKYTSSVQPPVLQHSHMGRFKLQSELNHDMHPSTTEVHITSSYGNCVIPFNFHNQMYISTQQQSKNIPETEQSSK